jgi:hypothetical protein
MLRSALEGEEPVLFSEVDPFSQCVFCGRPRPRELAGTAMCSQCKRKPLHELMSYLKGW